MYIITLKGVILCIIQSQTGERHAGRGVLLEHFGSLEMSQNLKGYNYLYQVLEYSFF